jgi:hypothetical protein
MARNVLAIEAKHEKGNMHNAAPRNHPMRQICDRASALDKARARLFQRSVRLDKAMI